MKRCCESCRFFKEAGFAGSGWCRHPQRLEGHSDLVLVRSNELACRKGWNSDLYERRIDGAQNYARVDQGFTVGPLPPATADEVAAVVSSSIGRDADSTNPNAETGQDLVVGASPSPMPHLPKSLLNGHLPQTDPDPGSPPEAANQRGSIRRAREVERARLVNRTRPTISLLPSLAPAPTVSVDASTPSTPDDDLENSVSGTSPDELPATDVVAPNDTGNQSATVEPGPLPVPPVPIAEFPVGTQPTERWRDSDDNRFGSVPERDPSFPLPIREGPSETPRAASCQELDLPEDVVADDIGMDGATPAEYSTSTPMRWARPRPHRRRPAFSLPTRWSVARDRVSPANPPQHVWPYATEAAGLEPGDQDRPTTIPDHQEIDADLHPTWSAAEEEPNEEWILPAWNLSIEDDPRPLTTEITSWQAHPVPPEHDVDTDTRPLPLLVADPHPFDEPYRDEDDDAVSVDAPRPIVYDPTIDDYLIAPDVPRMCRTCRDFRPADGGERGWCTNSWAFQHRRMVSACELPCQTPLGLWWLPHDDVWSLAHADRHADPTPLYDEMMSIRAAAVRHRAPARRRRRS